MMYFELREHGGKGLVEGLCASCGKPRWESLAVLDDCYNVWAGKCSCGAINLLSVNHGLRGYSSQQMHLVLPTDEEIAKNEMPQGIPSSGSKGPATMHGSPAGELQHILRKD
jgi:hypothetical protein